MTKHFETELGDIQQALLRLSGRVEDAVREAVASVEARDVDRARRVIAHDAEIDTAEVDLEEECLKVLALHQPVAIDLRFVVAAMKMNNDLERIGDLAANIAERAVQIGTATVPELPFDFHVMAEKAQAMLRDSLDAVINLDVSLAESVMAADEDVDAMHARSYEIVKAAIREDTDSLDVLIHMLGVSRSFERIADHATNIAEDVVYLIKGDIIRHVHPDDDAGGNA